MSIILILAGIATVQFQAANVRAKVTASQANLRTMSGALEAYRVDWNRFPAPHVVTASDPFGIFAANTLSVLTTPVAYVSSGAFVDPFGTLRIQTAQVQLAAGALDPPIPLNRERSMFYYYYPHFSMLTADPAMMRDGYCSASVGPDLRDSMVVYYPFASSLGSSGALYGINTVFDTVYDPTNGVASSGDIAIFGGDVPAPPHVGGGW